MLLAGIMRASGLTETSAAPLSQSRTLTATVAPLSAVLRMSRSTSSRSPAGAVDATPKSEITPIQAVRDTRVISISEVDDSQPTSTNLTIGQVNMFAAIRITDSGYS